MNPDCRHHQRKENFDPLRSTSRRPASSKQFGVLLIDTLRHGLVVLDAPDRTVQAGEFSILLSVENAVLI